MDAEKKSAEGLREPQADLQRLPSLERGYSINNNPNPQLFVVQESEPPIQPQRAAPPTTTGDDEKSEVDADAADFDGGSRRPRTLLGDETYPEGGLAAWLVVFGCWCGLFAAAGIMNSIATFQTYVAIHQLSDYDEGTIGWIFSVYTFLVFFCGIYIGPVFDKYGPRWLVLVGGVGLVLGIMLTSICTKYWHFLLAFGFLSGISSSLLFTPCFTAVGHFFRARRGMATGIASTGGGFGGVVFPLMLQSLFDRVGWAWALRILGFLCMFLVTLCNCFIRRRLPAAAGASPHPDFRIFRDRPFLFTTLGVFLLELGLFIPLAYISSYSLAQGFGDHFAFGVVLPVLNAASVFGRALPGYWADKIGPFNSNMLSVFLTIVACFVVWLPLGHTVAGVLVFAALFGFATGNNISITPVCVGRLCHTQHYGRYYATCYTVVSVATLVGIPIGGNIVAATGGDGGHQYWGLIVFTGLTQALSLSSFMVAKGVSVGWKPWVLF
ncbi:Riboflavin transporter MCH5 [Apiospora arundinis]|uniref:Major facilitator superfamily domain-containing protein n=1 Tax=Apiospora arundinis TaxID=335852 RepID=A0ABR2JHQ1_9PEZI